MSLETFDTIEIIRGAATAGTVTLTLNGTAVDITGYTGRLVAKKKKSDADGSAAVNVSLSISDAANGIFAYTIPAATTSALDPVSYEAEFHIVPASGQTIKVQGLIDATREVWTGS